MKMLRSLLGEGSNNTSPFHHTYLLFLHKAYRLLSSRAKEDIHIVKICINAPLVSHLFFSDNFLFLGRMRKKLCMKHILNTYEEALAKLLTYKILRFSIVEIFNKF